MRNPYHFSPSGRVFSSIKIGALGKLSKFHLLFFLAAFFFPLSPLQAAPPALDELVDRIQASYEQAVDLKARFTQETTIRSIKRVEREEGMVYFKKPKKMLWDYSRPKSKKLVINPKKAWLYIPEDKMVYVQDANKLLNSQLTIRFLTGVGRLKEEFDIRYARPKEEDAKGNYLLELTPRTAGAATGIERLSLTVGKEDYQIIGCSLQDTYGNLTRISFRSMEINNGLPDSLFTFTLPPGTTVQTLP